LRASSESSWSVYNPLLINIKPPRALPLTLTALHLAALLAVLMVQAAPFSRFFLLAGICVSGWLAIRELMIEEPLCGLLWRVDQKQLMIRTQGGVLVPVEQLLFSAKVPGLIALKMQRADRALPCWLVLTREQLDVKEWRRLSLVLQFKPQVQRVASGQE